MRINIRQLKRTSWVACSLALVLAGHTFWDIYRGKKVEKRYDPRGEEYYRDLVLRDIDSNPQFDMQAANYKEEEYERIWLARIDGSARPPPDDPTKAGAEDKLPDQPPVPPLEQIVKVGMLLWSADPTARIAAIEYVGDPPAGKAGPESVAKEKRLHLTQGELLCPPWDAEPYNGRVVRIDPQEVVFHWAEGEVTLHPGLAPEGGGLPIDQVEFDAVEDVWAGSAGQPAESQKRDDGSWIIGLEDQRFLAEGGAQQVLEEQVTARTITPAGGGRSSIELAHVEEGSMPARFGFQSGDRIISVNGHPLSSVAEAINWGKNHPNESQYHVVWERKGAPQETVIHWNNKGS